MNALQPQPSGIPTGGRSSAAAPYWEGCRQGELRYQRCSECHSVNMKPARSWREKTRDALRTALASGYHINGVQIDRPSRRAFYLLTR